MIDLEEHAREIVARYPEGRSRSALIPLLHLAQERDGYVTKSGIEEIGGILGLSPAEVTAVATFYTMLHTKPKGQRVISVCHNLACTLAGAEDVIAALEKELGIESGETTPNGAFTLERAECLAFCDKAPMLQIDYDEMIGPLAPDAAAQIVERLKVGREGAASGAPGAQPTDLVDAAPRASAHSQSERPSAARQSVEKEEGWEIDEPVLVESISLSEEEENWLHPESGSAESDGRGNG